MQPFAPGRDLSRLISDEESTQAASATRCGPVAVPLKPVTAEAPLGRPVAPGVRGPGPDVRPAWAATVRARRREPRAKLPRGPRPGLTSR